jgi:hypothetical protein
MAAVTIIYTFREGHTDNGLKGLLYTVISADTEVFILSP